MYLKKIVENVKELEETGVYMWKPEMDARRRMSHMEGESKSSLKTYLLSTHVYANPAPKDKCTSETVARNAWMEVRGKLPKPTFPFA